MSQNEVQKAFAAGILQTESESSLHFLSGDPTPFGSQGALELGEA